MPSSEDGAFTIGVDPDPMWLMSSQEVRETQKEGHATTAHRGRDSVMRPEAKECRGPPAGPEAVRGWSRCSLEPSEGVWPSHTLISDLRPPGQ